MRKTGITTRKIDNAVQDYFNNGFAYLYESRNATREANEVIFHTFSNRLFNEHNQQLNKDYQTIYNCIDGIWCFKVINLNYEKSRNNSR